MKYVDTSAIIQVIGNIYQNPNLLDNEKYFFNEEDFVENFHRVLFGAIYNLHQTGTKDIQKETIEKYLETKPKSYSIYTANRGSEYLDKLVQVVQYAGFDYYYQRMKKMTLLRMYNEVCGMNLSWLYDIDNILDIKKKQAQDEWLDNTSLETIAEVIDKKILDIKIKYVDDSNSDFTQAGTGIKELIQKLKDEPDIGYPMFGPLINAITRGQRLGKFFLRSGSTGLGKTRSMVADCCNTACSWRYDSYSNKWISLGTLEPSIYITTEQEIDEIQTMMLAFISDVEEENIMYGKYTDEEYERVLKAAEIIAQAPLQIKKLPNFSLKDIEDTIKYGMREFGAKYIYHDYLHSSMKILSEVSTKAGVKGLREDNVLFMISVRLKDLCNEYGVYIMSGTQLNGSYAAGEVLDQNALRGSKAIADKIDCGILMVPAEEEDLVALQSIFQNNNFDIPKIKMSIYKNRRGKYQNILLWCRDRRGVCKIEPMFATTRNYELVPIEDLKIIVKERDQLPNEI
jgi:replicative DNA helicase